MKRVFNTREPYKWKEERAGPQKKDYHIPKKCPVMGCNATVIKIKRHLTGNSHRITDVEELNVLCQRAKWEKTRLGRQIANKIQRNVVNAESLHSSESDSTYVVKKKHEEGATFWDEREGSDLDDWSSSASYSDKGTTSTSDSTELKNEIEDIKSFQLTNTSGTAAMLDLFYKYLVSADCGNKDPRSSKQHKVQVETILRAIDDKMDLLSLTISKAIRDTFLKRYCIEKKFGPRTVKAYLQSLDHFYNFLQSEVNFMFSNDLMANLKVKIKYWMKTYQRQSSQHKHLKDDYEEETQLTPNKITEFENSEVCRGVIMQLGQIQTSEKAVTDLSQQAYTNIRDFIMCEILINNAHRSGVLANLTMTEFLKFQLKEDLYIIKVHQHKTLGTHGPARIILPKNVFSWLETYIQKVRPIAEPLEKTNNKVFLTWNGSALTSGKLHFLLLCHYKFSV